MDSMKRHVRGTKAFTLVLLAASLVLALDGVQLSKKVLSVSHHQILSLPEPWRLGVLLALGYGCAAALIGMLWVMWRFLDRIERGEVFTKKNIRSLDQINKCCLAGAGLSLLLGIFFTWRLAAVSVCAAFMCLVVRVVQDAFLKAEAMKDELDLTI